MAMRRYEIRNEYGIGDPELYRVADKDDPEALLEGVAMSALVGLLRQLGDLSQFAAEIFHDLHEEVMATAARGHGLTARLQQLEAEFPFVEKACLSRTNHSPFFTNFGVDWHTNSRVEQNLVTQGDLPRFVMDSYEECRGPPRLFLLDKFDVAGAGACLKRYTDPSFFKVDAASSEIPTSEVQRERKVRKSKRKVSRWRNGETPAVAPASHAKLHELFLEERVENGHSHPARVVKLKRRQLNGSLFLVTSGKSYMEKFVETPSPENKMVCADSVTSPLKLTWDDSSEAGLELHDVGVVSPVAKSTQGKETTILLGNELVLLKSYVDEDNESNGETVDRAIVDVPGPMTAAANDDSLFPTLKTGVEEELALDGDAKIGGIFNGVLSDDMNSEIDNYTDALTTMESEMETDNEYKNDQVLLNVGKCGTDSDAIQKNLEVQSKFSGSQSMLNASLSYDGDSSAQIGQSNPSSSDCLCDSAESLPSDGEEVAELSPSFENHEAEIVDLPTDCQHMLLKARGTESGNLVSFNDTGINEDVIHPSLDVSSSSCPADSKDVVTPLVPVGNASCEISSGCVSLDSGLLLTSRSGMDLADSSVVTSDVQDFAFSEGHPMQKRNQEPNVSSDSLTHSSLLLESQFRNKHGHEAASEVQEVHEDILVKGNIGLPQSIISPLEVQLPCPDSQVDSGANLGVEPRLDASEDHISEECDDTDPTIHFAQVELESPEEFGNLDSEEEGDLEENSGTMYNKEIREVSREVDERVRDVAPSAEEEDSTVPSHNVDSAKCGESSSNLLVGDAMAFDCPSSTLVECKFYLSDEANELPQVGDSTKYVLVSTDADDETGNVVWSSSDVLPVSIDHIDQDSLSGSKFQHEERFSSEPIGELKSLEEVNQEVDVLDDLGSTSYKSAYDGDHSRPNVDELVPESFLTAQTRESLYCSENTEASVTAVSNSDLKLENCKSENTETGCDVLGSPLINVALTESSSELPSQLQAKAAVQLTAKDLHTGTGGASSESVHSGESGSSHQLLEFQIDQIVVPSLNTSAQSPELLNLQSEHIDVPSHIDEMVGLDDSVGSVLEDLRSQESVGTKPTSIPFSTVFPSPSTQAEPTCINLEEMPPLPPLPPMQWRMGKVPSAPLALTRECSDQSQDISPLTQPATLVVFPSSDKDILRSSLTELHGVLDGQRLQDALPESLANSCQPTLLQPSREVQTIVENAFGEEAHCPLEEAQCLNQSLALPEVSNNRGEHGVLDLVEEKQPETAPFSVAQVPDLEPTFLVRDPVPSESLQSSTKAGVGIQKSQDIVGEDEELTVPGNSASTHLEHQHQDELVNVQQETLWSPNTLALPSAYGFTRSNGNKLPLPRNPLIDAVAAHDKSKLRKVAEHVQSQIVPKLEERDSLLEQIRAKSFNLKPAKMTRPTIQGMQGPKTSLKVAAILEKANSIRQALAGSDEDDDSDNWSDS